MQVVAFKMVRVNDSWVKVVGKIDSPRNVFVVDNIAKNIINQLPDIGVDSEDQIVQFSRGDFATINEFLRMKKREFSEVQTIVFLWVGTEEIVTDAPPPNLTSKVIEEYFLPEGPRIIPHHDVEHVASDYCETVVLALALFPRARVCSTDPAPRRSTGFAISRANFVAKLLKQQGERHHHFTMNRPFHGKRNKGNFNEGGRYPLLEKYFSDGVLPTTETWSDIFDHAYAAMNKLAGLDFNAVALTYVKIVF